MVWLDVGIALTARNVGPTRLESCFLSPFGTEGSKCSTHCQPCKAEPQHSHAVYTLQVHLPTSPCSALSAHTKEILCRLHRQLHPGKY